jgi:hypothetical protein
LRTVLINLGLYQAGWFACVIGAAHGYPWLGAGMGLGLLTVHLVLCRERQKELFLVLFIAITGTLVDSIQAQFGVFVFLSGYWSQWVVPIWITVMWLQFASLFHFALSWLSGRYLLSGILGAFGGPLAYFTGERLGAAIFPCSYRFSLSVIAMVWALLLPACVLISDRFKPERRGYRFERTGV